MRTTADISTDETVFELAGDWKSNLAGLIRKEIQLAKTELGEKFGCLGRNAMFMAIGGVCALMAVLILMFSLGAIIALGLRAAGLSIGMSYFVAYIGLALILAGVGYGLLMKGMHAFSRTNMAPEKTIEALTGHPQVSQRKVETNESTGHKRSSTELKQEIDDTRALMEAEAGEIKERLKPKHMCKTAWAMSREHPVRVGLIALGTGLSTALLIRRTVMARHAALHASAHGHLSQWFHRLSRAFAR